MTCGDNRRSCGGRWAQRSRSGTAGCARCCWSDESGFDANAAARVVGPMLCCRTWCWHAGSTTYRNRSRDRAEGDGKRWSATNRRAYGRTANDGSHLVATLPTRSPTLLAQCAALAVRMDGTAVHPTVAAPSSLLRLVLSTLARPFFRNLLDVDHERDRRASSRYSLPLDTTCGRRP
jgi:hypothetical protein